MSPGAAPPASAGRDSHVGDDPAVERHDEGRASGVALEATDQARHGPLDDTHDRALRPAGLPPPLHARDHPVAVQRLVEAGLGDVEVAREPVDGMVRGNEAEAARVDLQAARHQRRAVRQAVAVPARADERAPIGERGEPAAHEGSLSARQAQVPHQLADGRRMVEVGADSRQEVFVGQHAVRR